MVLPDCPKCVVAGDTLKEAQRQLEREQSKVRLTPDQALRVIAHLKKLHDQTEDKSLRILARAIHTEIPTLARLKGPQWFDTP